MLCIYHADENNEKATNGAGVNDWHGGGGGGGGRYRCCYYGRHGCERCCATPDEVPQQVNN